MPKTIRRIYAIGGDHGYSCWMQGQQVPHMEDADLVLLTGGEDVSPSVYGEPSHDSSFFSFKRDEYELKEWKRAQNLGLHVIGICRGAQFCCAASGGRLVQDQHNPGYIHSMDTYDGKTLPISSTHHQAQHPWNLPEKNYKLLAWTHGASPYHMGGRNEEMVIGHPVARDREVEIAYYRNTKALAIQGHPEGIYQQPRYEATIIWLQNLLDLHMEDKL